MAEKSKNGFSYSKDKKALYGNDIITPRSRLGFARGLYEAASSYPGAKPKYSANFLFGKEDAAVKKEVDAIKEMCKLMLVDLFGARAGQVLGTFKDTRKMFRDGDAPSGNGKVYEGFAGCHVIVAKSAFPAGHYQGFKVIGKEVEEFQSGEIVRGVVQPYLNEDGFAWILRTVKFLENDGVSFGGAPDPSGLLDGLDEAVQAVQNNESGLDLSGL